MNDEQMRPVLKTWLRARSVGPADVPGGVARVVARLPQTRQRSRWWPLPALAREAPVPTTNGPVGAKGSTVFAALKLVAASVIVALFGGFLLVGISSVQRGDGLAPGVSTASPPPTATDELLAHMVTEEVEPGVFRIINDGVRDLAVVSTPEDDLGDDRRILAGPDGSVWLFTRELSFRLGDASRVETPDWGLGLSEADIEIGPDGYVWVIVDLGEGATELIAIADRAGGDEAAWVVERRALPDDEERDYLAVEALPDGTVIGVWPRTRNGAARGTTPVTVDAIAGDWVGGLVIEEPESQWSAEIELRDDSFWLERRFWDLAANDDEVWLADPAGSLHRRTASGWETVDPPFPPSRIDVGPDGTLWIQAGDYHGWTEGATNEEVLSLVLARFDGGQWETWDRDDDIPPVGPVSFSYSFPLEGVHAVAPDGSIWLAALDHWADRECGGIVDFDGATWTRYLEGRCVYDADITPDGAVWLQAGEVLRDGDPGPSTAWRLAPMDTYVITPGAAAATE